MSLCCLRHVIMKSQNGDKIIWARSQKLQCGIFRMSPPPSPQRPGLCCTTHAASRQQLQLHTIQGSYFHYWGLLCCVIDRAVIGTVCVICVMLGTGLAPYCHAVWGGQVEACVEIKVSCPGPALNTGLIVSWDMAAITPLKTELNIHCWDAVKTGD